ncbi:hypothetical protein I600_2214 [Maribacter dokdonensis DSW-8]|nr:hypothetical protein I600_2214 [Maribacter dokdonensis DSW-8]
MRSKKYIPPPVTASDINIYTAKKPMTIFIPKLFPRLEDLKKDFHCKEENRLNIRLVLVF